MMINLKNSTGIKLRVMMLMQYLLFAVWWVPLAAYLTNMGIEGFEKTLILSSMAIGSMASPILGALADRFFSAQKVLAVSNIITACLLILSSFISNPTILFITILLTMLCYMPTWSLVSTIAMKHTSSDVFPRIRMFGTIGWIMSGVFSLVAYSLFNVEMFDGSKIPLLCGAATALAAAVINLSLPDTPAIKNGEKKSIKLLLGFDAVSMYKDRNYLIFTIISMLAIIPFTLYFSFGSDFLQDNDFKYITFTMNWGQITEMGFLFIATNVIRKLGVKNALLIGLGAMLCRYLFFYFGVTQNTDWMFIIAILLHGLIFGLFFVGGQVYTEKIAPKHLKAQAQGLLSFMVWGVGLLLGNLICGAIIKSNEILSENGIVCMWDDIFMIVSIMSVVVILLFSIFFKRVKP